ncbi:MAG TPA: RNA polymerase sigma factor [Acidimicrobiales bacterium]|nr:RNA polymerase sigma factor [Acidimicrobiales bacterium]
MALLGDDEQRDDFARLFSEHRRALLRYVWRRLNDHASCEDVVVETFEVAWRRWQDLPPRDRELAWLYAIALRVLSNHQRSRDRRGRLLIRLSLERPRDIEEENTEQLFRDVVTRPLAELRTDERELLGLVYWEELSYREIAEVLGISENAVGIRINRTKAHLETLLQPAPSIITYESGIARELET